MSYCRFSSDNFMCDVYVYEDCYGGFTTHVAGNRYAFPPLPSMPTGWGRVFGGTLTAGGTRVTYPSATKRRLAGAYYWFFAKWEAVRSFTLDHIPRRRINLPNAGHRFNDATATECANRLMELKALGYKVPARAITALLAEDAAHASRKGGEK